MMVQLNLPPCDIKIKEQDGVQYIFDPVRKKHLQLTPEEWVRQQYVQYMIHHKAIPTSLIAIEMGLDVHKTKKRSDIVAYSRTGLPLLIVECKAPSVKITQAVFDQIARYNITLNAHFLAVTNGLSHYYCQIFPKEKKYQFLPELPDYNTMSRCQEA